MLLVPPRLPLFPYTTLFRSQNGPAASELRCRCVSLHHGLGLWPAAYKDVARTFVHHARAPLDFVIPTTTSLPSCSEPSRTKALRSEEHTSELQSLRHLVCRL